MTIKQRNKSNEIDAMMRIAQGFHKNGELIKAKDAYQKVLKKSKNNFEALYYSGILYAQEKNNSEALRLLIKASQINPKNYNVLYNLALVYQREKNWHKSLYFYNQCLANNPNDAIAHNNMGNVFKEFQLWKDAFASYKNAITINPSYYQPYSNCALALKELGRIDEALEYANVAIKLAPEYAEGFYNLGIILNLLKKHKESINAYKQAIKINIIYPEAHFNIGNILKEIGNYEDALVHFKKAIQEKSNYFEALANCGVVYQEINNNEDAFKYYEKAIKINPNYSDARVNKALLHLSMGQFGTGWELYEWRFKNKPLKVGAEKILSPDSDEIECFWKKKWPGKSSSIPLLIWGEQGLGDQLLYFTLLSNLENYSQEKFVATDKRLIPLLEGTYKNFKFIDIANIDISSWEGQHIPVGSLPRICRYDINQFINTNHKYIRIKQNTQDKISVKVNEKKANNENIVCGVSWSSSNTSAGSRKSIKLTSLLSTFAKMPITFIDLQYGNTSQEREELEKIENIDFIHLDEIDNTNNLYELAALIESCDVVITISNTTAHIAGALGKKTFLLLPLSGKGRFWYWSEFNGKNLWYASIKIFSQIKAGDWDHPIQKVKNELINFKLSRCAF
jgi:tetratricopeptide (TPR) repeat protein